jgi:hypothetical protein
VAHSVSGDLAVKLALDVAESPLPARPARPPRPPRPPRDEGERGPVWFAGAGDAVPPVPPAGDFGDFDRASADIDRAMADAEWAIEDGRRAMEDAEREAEWLDREADQPQAEDAPTRPDMPRYDGLEAAGPADDAERLAILTALERGEIDIDEAMRRLEPLGGDTTDLQPPERPEDR